ncbi:uncharacterized protein LOC142743724 [Rhinoderma darwinii]|uniref:uncharacterized protein LOC142743724 n=1 Tax=Rhinoderma darwinii TaxID=43563 RepID=UPI003F679D46
MPRGMDVERLLVLVQGHPEIWDTRSEAYHNRTAKEDAWEEVAKELFGQEWESGRTRDRSRLVQEIKTRWRSCRDQFRREMGERGRSGDGASRKRPYMYTQQLMFLKDIMEMRTTTDNLEDTAEETDVGESRPEPPAAPVLPPSPEPTPLEPAPGQSARAVASPAEERPVRARTRRARAQQASAAGQVDARVLDYLRRAAEEDGNDAFGRSIVPLLRLVPMDRISQIYMGRKRFPKQSATKSDQNSSIMEEGDYRAPEDGDEERSRSPAPLPTDKPPMILTAGEETVLDKGTRAREISEGIQTPRVGLRTAQTRSTVKYSITKMAPASPRGTPGRDDTMILKQHATVIRLPSPERSGNGPCSPSSSPAKQKQKMDDHLKDSEMGLSNENTGKS